MFTERWDEIKEKLLAALELAPEERSAYLAQIGSVDPDLQRELASLIASHKQTGTDFLDSRVSDFILASTGCGEGSSFIGRRIGCYQIVQLIGAGGMGEVYRAFRADDQYCKQVGIKLIRVGQDSHAVVQRFRIERQILSSLDHPNIARMLDGGATEEGLPYFVMELVEGMPIDEYCNEHRLSIRDRLELFIQVCSAVQYAHQRLIIHRDIKPGNILVTGEGAAKLLDFGIAKLLDADAGSELYQPTLAPFQVLTPGYASPEQIRAQPISITSDIYSLGVVLYELLTGRSPYRVAGRTASELSWAACEEEPENLSSAVHRAQPEKTESSTTTPNEIAAARQSSPKKLSKRLKGDLDNIVGMALRKEPQRRYASVEQFAQDLRRYLDSFPVMARRDSFSYRTARFVNRHRFGAIAAGLVAVALLTATLVTLRANQVAWEARARAEHRFNDVRTLANSLLFDIHDSIENLPGATAARKVLVDRAVQYLDSLAREATEDPGLQREVASAYERLGDLQDKPNAVFSSLGDEVAAMQSYNKSLNLREKLARTKQANAGDSVSLARIHRLIANAAADSGEVSSAVEHAKKALAVATVVSEARQGNNTAAESELAWDYMALGVIESNGGFNSIGLSEPYAAIRDYEKALAIASELLKNDPDNASLAYEVAGFCERIGWLQAEYGNRPEGLCKLNSALKMFRTAGARSGNARLPSTVAAVSSIIGLALEMDGRFQSALAYFDLELATFKSRAERDPQDMMARSDLSGAYYDVGDTLVKMGRFKDGLPTIRRAIALDRELVSIDPKRGALRSLLAQHRVAEAEALNKIGAPATALQSYKEAYSLYQSLAALDDQNLDARLNVSATDAKVGATYVRLGRFDDAREAYMRALRVSEPPAANNPPNLQAQYTLADTYSGLGDIAMHGARRTSNSSEQLSYWREATSWYEKSLGTWRVIPNRSVISPSQFDVGDPVKAAKHLAECKAALYKLNNPL
jgi:serine/threonine protein kinase/tetratricopeptide (TPR) repeat protein